MAKIDFPGGPVPFFNSEIYANTKTELKKAKDKPSVQKGRKTRFLSILEQVKQDVSGELEAPPELPLSEEAVQELMDEVHSAGDALKKRPFGEEILRYKTAVRGILHYVETIGYTTEIQPGIPNYLKPGFKGIRGSPESQERAKLIQIQVVDRKLEQLAAGILEGQMTQFKLLAQLEEITGLLVNLLE
jgi:uncharacterized protein YaaR (DUF327 family)